MSEKMVLTVLSFFMASCFLAGCGRQAPAPAQPQVEVSPESGSGAESDRTACLHRFPAAGFCAQVTWDKPLTADEAGAVSLVFHRLEDSTQAPAAPPAEPRSFFVMKCCKTPTAVALQKVGEGKYRGEGILLLSGEYWFHVQLGDKDGSEKATLDLSVP